MGYSKSSSKRGFHSNTILPQETRRTLDRQSNFTWKTTGKRRTKKKKIRRRKETIKIQAEIHEKEIKEAIVNFSKTKSWFFEKINKIDQPLARLIKEKREKNQIKKLEIKKERLQQTMQKYKGL